MRFIGAVIFCGMITMLALAPSGEAADVTNSLSLKISIDENGNETEFEYVNPDEYEIEKNGRVYKDRAAKNEIITLYKKLGISTSAKAEQMAFYLKKHGFEHISRLDIRWINDEGELYTWVWNK